MGGYGHQHPLTYKQEGGEKYIFGLNLPQLIAWGIGLYLATVMMKYVPLLPIDNIVLCRTHYLLPLGVCLFFAYVQEQKTQLPILKYLYFYVIQRLSPRQLI